MFMDVIYMNEYVSRQLIEFANLSENKVTV